MGIFSKPPRDASGPEPDRLWEAACDKKDAAARLSAAITAAGEAMTALFDADRAFCAEWNARHGDWGHGTARLMRQLRPMLLGDLELNAPELLQHLNQPRQSRGRCETIASLIARQVDNDLASEPLPKEPAQ